MNAPLHTSVTPANAPLVATPPTHYDPRVRARQILLNPECFRYRALVPGGAVPPDAPDAGRGQLYDAPDRASERALVNGNLGALPVERMQQLYESIRWDKRSSKFAIALDRYLIRRDEQHEKLQGLNADALVELVSQGYLPAEISDMLGVSYAVIHAYMKHACEGSDRVEEALELCADMQAYRGLQDIEEANENSKAGVQKGVELAKQRMAIAKAMNPKRYGEKPNTLLAGGPAGEVGAGGAWLVLDVTSNLSPGASGAGPHAGGAGDPRPPKDVTPRTSEVVPTDAVHSDALPNASASDIVEASFLESLGQPIETG